MRSVSALLLLVPAACSPSTEIETGGNSVDISGAASRAQGDIDRYAVTIGKVPARAPGPHASAAPSPAPLNPPAPGEPGGLADDRRPMSEAPFTPQSAQGAAQVVQTYYALLGEGKIARAWALWAPHGGAAPANADALAASFADYAEYHANVGAPGAIDAGAGQRYVSVPVQVYGRMKSDGKPFSMLGEVVLHRTGDVDGATMAQRTWHIASIALTPAGRQR